MPYDILRNLDPSNLLWSRRNTEVNNRCVRTVFLEGSQGSTLLTSCISWSCRSWDSVWWRSASWSGVSPSLSCTSSLASARTSSCEEKHINSRTNKQSKRNSGNNRKTTLILCYNANARELIYKVAAYNGLLQWCTPQLWTAFFLESTRWQRGNLNSILHQMTVTKTLPQRAFFPTQHQSEAGPHSAAGHPPV